MTDAGAGRRRAVGQRPANRPAAPPPLGPDCALFLDVDGTLIDIAPTPDHVQVDRRLAALLPALGSRLGGAIALITGRAIADVDRLFPALHLPVAGQHGLERRSADGTIHRHRPALAGIGPLRHELARFAARHDGLLLEDKGATLALHYRRAPGLASHVHRTLRTYLATIVTPGSGWRLQPGKSVLEVTPDGRDKGTAICEYLGEPPFAGRIPVFVGDDRTDELGFAAVAAAGGWGVKVGPGRTHARHRLPDVAAVRHWLAALSRAAVSSSGGAQHA